MHAIERRARGLALAVRAWPVWELPPWLAAFVAAVIAAAAAAAGAATVLTPLRAGDAELFGILLACGAVTVEMTRRAGEPGGFDKDVYAIWDLPAAVLLPPLYALIAPVPRMALTQWRIRRTLIYRRVFTAASVGLAYAAASVAFHAAAPAITGAAAGSGLHALIWTLLVAGCGLLRLAVNHALVLTAVKGAEPATRARATILGREPLYNDVAELCMGVLVTFGAAHDATLVLYALPLVILVQRSLRHAQLLDASRIDGKTGLLNAPTWQHEAALEVTRAARTRSPLAVAIADIDHFKNVNDTFGHLAGDAVLAGLAAALRALLRDYDIVCRFGGEEFAILLPHTDAQEATRIAERLREKISQIAVPVSSGPPASEPLRVTISIGVATLSHTRRDLDELIAAADHALYQAKNGGRNAVRVTSDSSS